MGQQIKGSLTDRIREAARKLGEFSVQEIFDAVAPTIASAHAAARAKSQIAYARKRRKHQGFTPPRGGLVKENYQVDELVHKGKVTAVNVVLSNLTAQGWLERTKPGYYRFVNKDIPPTLCGRLREELSKRGECSIALLACVLSSEIDDADALRIYQRHLDRERLYRNTPPPFADPPLTEMIAHGKRRMISQRLQAMANRNQIRKVSSKVYAPLSPQPRS